MKHEDQVATARTGFSTCTMHSDEDSKTGTPSSSLPPCHYLLLWNDEGTHEKGSRGSLLKGKTPMSGEGTSQWRQVSGPRWLTSERPRTAGILGCWDVGMRSEHGSMKVEKEQQLQLLSADAS